MKDFSNPWGNKSTEYKRWYTNKWIEGGEYYDKLYVQSTPNDSLIDGSDRVQVLKNTAVWLKEIPIQLG